jgi:hypothetical protein
MEKFMNAFVKNISAIAVLVTFATTSRAQNWVELTPASGNAPAPRVNAAAVYDSLNHRLVIFGGKAATGDLNDVWAFDLRNNSWSNLTPSSGTMPAPRFTANGVYNFAKQQMIMWSGQGSAFFNDVWAFDLNAQSWSQFNPPNPKPNIRYGTAAVFDPKAKELVTFAGFTDAGRFDDTWRFNVNSETWKEVSTVAHPEKRCLHTASYDALKHRMIIYGGQTNGPRGDIWAFDLAQNTWTDLTPANSPAGRWFPTNIFDAANNRVIIFGGNLGSSQSNETWAFNLMNNTWQQLLPSGSAPEAREGAAAIYIHSEGRIIVFGGRGGSFFNDVWSLRHLSPPTTVENNSANELPATFRLWENYPNPFNRSTERSRRSPETTIAFEAPASTHASLRIYNLQGQLIKNLFDGKIEAGRHQTAWNGTNDWGSRVTSGIYFYVLQAGAVSISRKLALVE